MNEVVLTRLKHKKEVDEVEAEVGDWGGA